MKKSTGKYIIEGTKEGFSYYIHHFSKFFAFWVMEIATFFGNMTIFLEPVFQKFHIQMCKMVDDSGEANMSKAFDQSDHKKGYRSLLLFDVIWLLVTVAGVFAIMGLAYLIGTIIFNIGFYSYPSYSPMPQASQTSLTNFTNLLYIPFLVFALIFVIFALMVKEAGVYASYRNPELGLSDILFNAFATLKECGGRLFLVNFLMFLEVLTYAAIIVVPIFIISVLSSSIDPNDSYLALYIIWILVPIFTVVSIFVVPVLIGIFRLSVHKFLMDNVRHDAVIIAYRKDENKAKENDFIPLTEEKDINGETIYVEMKKKTKKNKDASEL